MFRIPGCDIRQLAKKKGPVMYFAVLACLAAVFVMSGSFGGKNGAAETGAAVSVQTEAAASAEKMPEDLNPAGNFTEEDFKPKASEDSYVWDIFKLLVVLGIMVGGFYYFFRYVTRKTGLNVHGEDVIQTLAMVPVGQNKYIQVVDLAGRILVLGITDGGISLITEVTGREQIDRIHVMSSRTKPAPGPAAGFQDYLKEQLGRQVIRFAERFEKKSGPVPEEKQESSDSAVSGEKEMNFLKQQKSRLKDLGRYKNE